MLYRNNSLLNLIIILLSLFFFTVLFAENNDFILPKKKIFIPSEDNAKEIKETKNNNKIKILPQKKPLKKRLDVSKKIKDNQKEISLYDSNLPQKKPTFDNKIRNIEEVKKFLEKNKDPKIKNNTNVKTNTNIETKKILVDKTLDKIKKLENKKNTEISKGNDNFLYPIKKPLKFKVSTLKETKTSKILNQKDFIRAKEVFNLINRGKWINALSATKKIKDKDFKNLVTWLYLKKTGNQATFLNYQNFITKNPEYPRIGRLKYLAEHKIIIKNSSPKSIINWFEKNPPLSGIGKIKLGEAYVESGERELAIDLIKSGWIDAKLSKGDLRYYRNKFKKILTTQDHLKRADHMAWSNKYWDLKRMLRYLPKNERLLYNARFILMTNSYGVDKAISDVPQNLKNDLGLQYNRLIWRTRRNRLEGSLEILRNFHGEETLIYPERWWKMRENITRDLIYAKKYDLAYEVSSNHHLQKGPEFADAEWISGWLSLSFLNKPSLSIKHFENFYRNVGYPISLARGAYWLGLAHEKNGDKDEAKKFFNQASKFTNTYYGQLSFKKIKPGKNFIISNGYRVKNGYEKKFKKNKLIKHVVLLKELDRTKFSKDILKHLAKLNPEEGSEILAAKLSTEISRFDYAIQIAKEASYQKRFINIYNYPVISIPKEINGKRMPPQNLILAIIRQESEFDSRANSYVGARGLMQIMPATAKIVAKRLKTTYSKTLLTKDVNYNIKLGTYYFNSLLEDYDGVYPFAIGAYNAGPNRIKSWIKKYGDPNKKEISFVDWIELIRFKETRNYVQRVIENINVYKYTLNNEEIKIDNFFKY